MDSPRHQRNAGMGLWRRLFGGNQTGGRLKLFGFLLAFLVLGGLAFAVAS